MNLISKWSVDPTLPISAPTFVIFGDGIEFGPLCRRPRGSLLNMDILHVDTNKVHLPYIFYGYSTFFKKIHIEWQINYNNLLLHMNLVINIGEYIEIKFKSVGYLTLSYWNSVAEHIFNKQMSPDILPWLFFLRIYSMTFSLTLL
jgi:hypothetical protein